jgi:hypothetical protein
MVVPTLSSALLTATQLHCTCGAAAKTLESASSAHFRNMHAAKRATDEHYETESSRESEC